MLSADSKPTLSKRLQRLSAEGVGTGLRWWAEVLLVLAFYATYTTTRNQFGSVSVSPQRALENAESIIDFERSLGLFQELRIQDFFIDWRWFI